MSSGVSVDEFQALEQKVLKAVEIVKREREARAVAALNHERLRGWLTRNKMPDDTKRLTKTANHGAE